MAKILIIDDDRDIAEAMKITLESKDYQIAIAYTGDDGLKQAKSNKPDLVILDVMMETADKGFEVARALKSEPGYKDIPILMLTAIKDKMGLDFKNEAGDEIWLPVDEYMEKPLKPQELLVKVSNLLSSK